jgi:L-aspartate oxidase
VAPAAHYLCGGIVADLDGASSLPGLWVAGEAACNGVHGANRLASNSLLDGMVYGPRVVEAVGAGLDGPRPTGAMRSVLGAGDGGGQAGGLPGRAVALPPSVVQLGLAGPGSERGAGRVASDLDTAAIARARADLQRAMTADAGVLRSGESLARAAAAVAGAARVAGTAGRSAGPDPGTAPVTVEPSPPGPTDGPWGAGVYELRNLATVAGALCAAADARTESRGAHARTDHTETSPTHLVRYLVGPAPG